MAFFTPRVVLASLLALPVALGLGTPKTCSNPPLSCSTSTSSDLCCLNSPGGQLLQTQFWDTSPSTGPSNSWTIHGLWPDHCDGTYDSNCDTSRAYTNITEILKSFDKTDLLDYMNKYWLDENGDNESFWEHEWGKHGTCISTLEPSCYTDYTATQEVPDFFQKTVDLFKTLDSYTALANAGITPSSSKTYTSAAILAALKKSFGYEVIIQCASGALDEIWYSYDVRGSVVTGDFVATDPDGSKSNCAASGIKYLPKSGGGTGTTSTKTPTTSTSTPTGTGSFSGTGYLNAVTGGSQTGCLISSGNWYTSGTCATYTAAASGSGFTLKSSKGPCGISSSAFTCASGTTATVFTAKGGLLSYNGDTTFYAAAVPSGSTQESISTSSKSVSVSFQWQSL
ncbi:Ribonuclease T2-like [Lachnellula occidentalis]|uniref:Ribonuclease T2-like n=1 Tax=Lachnellula occidentalis TaxID=215460 RepID=A0A8H8UH91_9HELO|nr:Ribonuclease T2-like [Lachnellula occidentalis]